MESKQVISISTVACNFTRFTLAKLRRIFETQILFGENNFLRPFFFVTLGGSAEKSVTLHCFTNHKEQSKMFIVYTILVALAVGLIVGLIKVNSNKTEQIDAKSASQRNLEQGLRLVASRQRLMAISRDKLVSQYGEPTSVFTISPDDVRKQILVFCGHGVIAVGGQIVSVSDIKSCDCESNTKSTTKSTSTTTTDSKDMLKRAAVGGVLLGGAGAVIGGATSKRNTETISNTTSTTSYQVKIATADRLFTFDLGTDGQKAQELVGFINKLAGLQS